MRVNVFVIAYISGTINNQVKFACLLFFYEFRRRMYNIGYVIFEICNFKFVSSYKRMTRLLWLHVLVLLTFGCCAR